MENETPTPRWIVVIQAVGSVTLGLGTLALRLKVPEIYNVVNKIKGLEETVITVIA